MKTFKQFIYEASTTQRLKIATAKLIAKNPDNSVYKTLLDRIRERQAPLYPDYPGRESARKDKTLIPSRRTSSFPELEGISTRTKNPKKLRKQKALGEIEESSSYVILEVRRPESGSPEELARWDRQKARQDALDNPSSKIIGITGRDKKGIQQYGLKDAERRRQQGKNRSSRLTDIDSDLDPEKKKRGDKKASLIGSGNRNASPPIKGRGKEVHHGTSIAQSAKEFAGLSPEQKRVKRKTDAQGGKYHGSDPGNLIQTDGPKGGTGIPHRGEGGYHSRQKPVGKGGSIQDFGSEKEIVAVKKGRERRGYSELERFAREKGIETPKMQKQRELRARMSANAKASGFD